MRKFLKRVTSLTPPGNRHAFSTTIPSSPTDANDEMDNRSERSRASRLKGITNRLFNGMSSKRAIPTEVSATATLMGDDVTNHTDEDEVLADSVIVSSSSGVALTDPKDGISSHNSQILSSEGEKSTVLTEESNDQSSVITVSKTKQPTPVDADSIYVDDEKDSAAAKNHRCCFLFC